MIYGNFRNDKVTFSESCDDLDTIISGMCEEAYMLDASYIGVLEVAVIQEGAKDFIKNIFQKILEFLKKVKDFILKYVSKLEGSVNKFLFKNTPDMTFYNGNVIKIKDYYSLLHDNKFSTELFRGMIAKLGIETYAAEFRSKLRDLRAEQVTKDKIDNIRKESVEKAQNLFEKMKDMILSFDKANKAKIKDCKDFPSLMSTFKDIFSNPKEIQFDSSQVNKFTEVLELADRLFDKDLPSIGKDINKCLSLLDDASKKLMKDCEKVPDDGNSEINSAIVSMAKGFSYICTNVAKCYEGLFVTYNQTVHAFINQNNMILRECFAKPKEKAEPNPA